MNLSLSIVILSGAKDTALFTLHITPGR